MIRNVNIWVFKHVMGLELSLRGHSGVTHVDTRSETPAVDHVFYTWAFV